MSIEESIEEALKAEDEETLVNLIDSNRAEISTSVLNSVLVSIGAYGFSGRGNRYWEIVEMLLSINDDVDIFTCTFLELNDQAEALLKSNPNIVHNQNAEGMTALHCAAERGNIYLARILVEMGANINAFDSKGEPPMLRALHAGPWKAAPADDVVELLLAKGAHVDFWVSAALGSCVRIERILSQNEDIINNYDGRGHTALFHACHNNKLDAVKLLIAYNADVNKENRDGQTGISTATMHSLSQECDPEIIRSLIAAGATCTIHSAIAINDLDLVKVILAADKTVLQDENCTTPLGYAIHTWKPEILKYLVSEDVALSDDDWGHVKRISENDASLIAELESLLE